LDNFSVYLFYGDDIYYSDIWNFHLSSLEELI